jgi:hypothetical protein
VKVTYRQTELRAVKGKKMRMATRAEAPSTEAEGDEGGEREVGMDRVTSGERSMAAGVMNGKGGQGEGNRKEGSAGQQKHLGARRCKMEGERMKRQRKRVDRKGSGQAMRRDDGDRLRLKMQHCMEDPDGHETNGAQGMCRNRKG